MGYIIHKNEYMLGSGQMMDAYAQNSRQIWKAGWLSYEQGHQPIEEIIFDGIACHRITYEPRSLVDES